MKILKRDIAYYLPIISGGVNDAYNRQASPADAANKPALKHMSSWGAKQTPSHAGGKASGTLSKSSSFEQFQKLAKEKEEKVNVTLLVEM